MSYYDNEIHVDFAQPVELKKNKTYIIKNLGAELPGNVAIRIIKELQKQTKSKFILLQGSSIEILEVK